MSAPVTFLDGRVTLYLGDCREVLPTLGRVDAVVTDPPYGVDYEGSVTKHGRNGHSYRSFDDSPANIEAICVPAVRLAISLARSAIVTPGNANAFKYDEPSSLGAIYYPSGANSGPWGFVCSQPLFYYGKDPYLMKALGRLPNAFSTTEATDRSIDHPCPKPLKHVKWMVNRVSFPGETILDPFMGSGTTGVAAVKLGRCFIGIEIEPKYFEIACSRIQEATRQPDLFLGRPPDPIQLEMAL
jgi:site-specific DNA-methyltransferase (adenine-specific)/modification methylase